MVMTNHQQGSVPGWTRPTLLDGADQTTKKLCKQLDVFLPKSQQNTYSISTGEPEQSEVCLNSIGSLTIPMKTIKIIQNNRTPEWQNVYNVLTQCSLHKRMQRHPPATGHISTGERSPLDLNISNSNSDAEERAEEALLGADLVMSHKVHTDMDELGTVEEVARSKIESGEYYEDAKQKGAEE